MHLCKSILLANVQWCSSSDSTGFSAPSGTIQRMEIENAPFYLVVVQYARRFNAEAVARFIRGLNAGSGIARKHFVFRLAEDVEAITGYPPGGVTPLGCRVDPIRHLPIPVIVDSAISDQLPAPRQIWLGGGRIDVKWRTELDEFLSAFPVLSAPVSHTDELGYEH